MKKLWLYSLALNLGLLGLSPAFGQAPNGYNNFGPSSYPVAAPPSTRSVLQSLPQVPQAYNTAAARQQPTGVPSPAPFGAPYQLVAVQDGGVYNPAPQNLVPEANPAPAYPQGNAIQGYGMPPDAGNGQSFPHATPPQSPPLEPHAQGGGPSNYYGYPPPHAPGYSQMVAPNCNSCGPSPVSDMMYAPSYHSGYNAGFMTAGPQGPIPGGSLRTGLAHLGGSRVSLPQGAKPWFFGGGVLLFHRIDNKSVPLSMSDNAYAPDILNTNDARMGRMTGFEVMMGRYFNCGKNAIAASYWGVFSGDVDDLRARTMPGEYRSRLSFQYMEMADDPRTGGAPDPYAVYGWYDNAYTHLLRRSSQYHNVEVNLLGFASGGAARNFNMPTAGSIFSGGHSGHACGYCGGAGCGACGGGAPSKFATGPCCLTPATCGSRLNLSWLAGFRYFRFEDNLLYASSLQDSAITRAGDDMYYEVNTSNDLFGAQLGSRADYCMGTRVNLYGTVKAGIYNNHSRLMSSLGTDMADAYLNDTRLPLNTSQGQAYRFDEMKDEVAFLSELGTGVGVRVSSKWTATFGYRAVIASGVATSPDNVKTVFANYEDIRDFNNRGTLVLHGVNMGALYNY